MHFMTNYQVIYAGAEKEMLKESQVYTGIADKAAPKHTWLSQVLNHSTSSCNLGSKQKCTFTYELHHNKATWRLLRLLGPVSTLDLIMMHNAAKVTRISAGWLPHNMQLQRTTGSAWAMLKRSSHSNSWKFTIQLCTTHRLQSQTKYFKKSYQSQALQKRKEKNRQEQILQL